MYFIANKSKLSPSTILFFGDNACGKSKLLEKFCEGIKGSKSI